MPSTVPERTGGPIHVAVAVLRDGRGRVLLTRRPDHAHLGGLWEFPGGKLERGETVGEALRRELHEELGVAPGRHRPLIRITHDYPDKSVLLDVHEVETWTGAPEGREGQPLAWVAPVDLRRYRLPEADGPIVTAVDLPPCYRITPALGGDLARLRSLLSERGTGPGLVQLRDKSLAPQALGELAAEAVRLCRAAGARLLVNADPAFAEAVGADGVHLDSRQLASQARRPLPPERLVAASCHDAADLAKAEQIGADFAVLSPVLPTASHPDAKALGWEGFADLVEGARIPVYALGGMHQGLLERAWDAGAQGVAGIRGMWSEE